jgi:hypothetical protein
VVLRLSGKGHLPRRRREQWANSTLLRRRPRLSCDAVVHHGHVRDKALLAPGCVALRKPSKIDIRQPDLAGVPPDGHLERQLEDDQSKSLHQRSRSSAIADHLDRRRVERHASFERGDCMIDACNNKQSVGLNPSFEPGQCRAASEALRMVIHSGDTESSGEREQSLTRRLRMLISHPRAHATVPRGVP